MTLVGMSLLRIANMSDIDIEQEFQKLVQEAIDKIKAREKTGEYQVWESGELIQKFGSILDHGDTSRYGNICPDGHTHECGWSPSMGYHCN